MSDSTGGKKCAFKTFEKHEIFCVSKIQQTPHLQQEIQISKNNKKKVKKYQCIKIPHPIFIQIKGPECTLLAQHV